MQKIENINELRLEILRLKAHQLQQEAQMNQDWTEIKESYNPVNLLKRATGGLLGNDSSGVDKSNILLQGLGLASGLLTERFMFKHSSLLVKTIVTFLVKKLTTDALASKPVGEVTDNVLSKIKGLFSKKPRASSMSEDIRNFSPL